jgi:hypothetical protein
LARNALGPDDGSTPVGSGLGVLLGPIVGPDVSGEVGDGLVP